MPCRRLPCRFASAHRLARGVLCLVLGGWGAAWGAWAEPAPLPAPADALARLDRTLWDDPVGELRQAQHLLRPDAPPAPPAQQLRAALSLALAGELLEQDDNARRGVDIGLPLARQLGDQAAVCLLQASETTLATAEMPPEPALRQLGDAADAAARTGQPGCAARLRMNQGHLLARLDRNAQALATVLEAQRLLTQAGDVARAASVQAWLCWLYSSERGSAESAQRAVEAGQAGLAMLARETGRRRYLAAVLHFSLARAHHVAQQLVLARQHAETAMGLAREIEDEVGAAYIAGLHGRIALDAGQPAQALRLFTQAQAVFARRELDAKLLEAGLGRVQALTALRRRADAQQQLDALASVRSRLRVIGLELLYQTTALAFYEAFGEGAHALQASKARYEARERFIQEDNRKALNELQERLETQRKEAENQMLREQTRAAQSQRWLMGVTLVLSLLLMTAMGGYLVQQHRLRLRLAELASRDDLTGMPNRRAILQTARQVQERRRTLQASACVALLDIDHFKAVNDRYGHEVGDAALISFSRACASALRQQDRLGRFGGEEFLLVLPGAELADLGRVFERLRAALQAMPVPGMPPEARLSFSMGGALLRVDEVLEQAVHRADEALYRAKAQGRNCLALAAEDQAASA